jgi:pimeloyl-ACP methyl ester carboxylesterase
MGSRHLERNGHRVLAYDARGHGASSPGGYEYADLARDLATVMDAAGFDGAVLAGASMGAHTIVRFALDHPDRAAALVLITPAFDPEAADRGLERWDALLRGLREGGVEGFLEAYGEPRVPESFRETVKTVLRQRLSAHEHPEAVADAIREVPRTDPFASWDDLADLDLPVTVVASRDEADPEHPYATGERYAEAIPRARLVSEEPGKSPLAWQGGQLSRVIAEQASA